MTILGAIIGRAFENKNPNKQEASRNPTPKKPDSDLNIKEDISLVLDQINDLLSDPLISNEIAAIISRRVNKIAQSKTRENLSTLDEIYNSLSKIIGFKLHFINKIRRLTNANPAELDSLENKTREKIQKEIQVLHQLLGIDENENIKE